MARQSRAWKNLERLVAKVLKGTRVLRGNDFSVKRVDVEVDDFPMLKIDAKYRQRWSHHKFLAEVAEKYCNDDVDIAILVTKHPRQRGAVVVMDLDQFGILLDTIRDFRDGC